MTREEDRAAFRASEVGRAARAASRRPVPSTTPALEAARHRAVATLAARFEASCGHVLGGRWWNHYESWLFSRRAARAARDADDGNPSAAPADPVVPDPHLAGRCGELRRKLVAAGATEFEAKGAAMELSRAAAKALAQVAHETAAGSRKPVKLAYFDVDKADRRVDEGDFRARRRRTSARQESEAHVRQGERGGERRAPRQAPRAAPTVLSRVSRRDDRRDDPRRLRVRGGSLSRGRVLSSRAILVGAGRALPRGRHAGGAPLAVFRRPPRAFRRHRRALRESSQLSFPQTLQRVRGRRRALRLARRLFQIPARRGVVRGEPAVRPRDNHETRRASRDAPLAKRRTVIVRGDRAALAGRGVLAPTRDERARDANVGRSPRKRTGSSPAEATRGSIASRRPPRIPPSCSCRTNQGRRSGR